MSLYSIPSQNGVTHAKDKVQANDLILTNVVDRDFLAKYISYARMKCFPKIPDENVIVLVKEYQKMRSMGNNKKTITATPR